MEDREGCDCNRAAAGRKLFDHSVREWDHPLLARSRTPVLVRGAREGDNQRRWWGDWDSNPEPGLYESPALTD